MSIRVFGAGPAWGLPLSTCAPFPAKLEAWLRMAGIPYEFVVENDPSRGPKGKMPWIADGEAVMGDTELIIAHLSARHGVDPDAGLSGRDRGISVAFHRLLEEHFHQVWEYLTFVWEGGREAARSYFDSQFPPQVGAAVQAGLAQALGQQLHARGIGRHAHGDIVRMGVADLEALSALLGDRPYFLGQEPTNLDATAFGFLALTVWTPEISPVHSRARSLSNLAGFCLRMGERYFPQEVREAPATRALVGAGAGS